MLLRITYLHVFQVEVLETFNNWPQNDFSLPFDKFKSPRVKFLYI